jgi:hypothetical protein
MALEGLVIDSDHWRHFYPLMAMVWGMAVARVPGMPEAPRLSDYRVLAANPG